MKLLAVDGTNAIMRRLSATKGDPHDPTAAKEAAQDTVPRILRAARDVGATHIIAALDDPHNSWRYTVYPDYKGAVKSAEIRAASGVSTCEASLQLGEALEAAGVKVVAAKTYEADDIVATLAQRCSKTDRTCYTLSSDNDLLQLACLDNVHVMQYAEKGQTPWLVERDDNYVAERFGVLPMWYPDYLTLVGGKNKVRGLKGVGPKTAAKLIVQVGTLERLIAAGKVPEDQIEWLRTAKRLHTLVTDVPLPAIDPKTCRVPT